MHTPTYSPRSHTPAIPAGRLVAIPDPDTHGLPVSLLRERVRIWTDIARQATRLGERVFEASARRQAERYRAVLAAAEARDEFASDPARMNEAVLCNHGPSGMAVGE